MLLTIQNIQKYFGAELCLRNISCVLDAQDRAGIIGENGAGFYLNGKSMPLV